MAFGPMMEMPGHGSPTGKSSRPGRSHPRFPAAPQSNHRGRAQRFAVVVSYRQVELAVSVEVSRHNRKGPSIDGGIADCAAWKVPSPFPRSTATEPVAHKTCRIHPTNSYHWPPPGQVCRRRRGLQSPPPGERISGGVSSRRDEKLPSPFPSRMFTAPRDPSRQQFGWETTARSSLPSPSKSPAATCLRRISGDGENNRRLKSALAIALEHAEHAMGAVRSRGAGVGDHDVRLAITIEVTHRQGHGSIAAGSVARGGLVGSAGAVLNSTSTAPSGSQAGQPQARTRSGLPSPLKSAAVVASRAAPWEVEAGRRAEVSVASAQQRDH